MLLNYKVDTVTMEEELGIDYGTDDRDKISQGEYMNDADGGNGDGQEGTDTGGRNNKKIIPSTLIEKERALSYKQSYSKNEILNGKLRSCNKKNIFNVQNMHYKIGFPNRMIKKCFKNKYLLNIDNQ